MAPDAALALASPARTIAGLIAVYEAERERFGGRTALNLPALTVRVQDMLDALEALGGPQARARVQFRPDASVARLVDSWPARVEPGRSLRLGLQADADFAASSTITCAIHARPVTA